jgi:hypothetical protein
VLRAVKPDRDTDEEPRLVLGHVRFEEQSVRDVSGRLPLIQFSAHKMRRRYFTPAAVPRNPLSRKLIHQLIIISFGLRDSAENRERAPQKDEQPLQPPSLSYCSIIDMNGLNLKHLINDARVNIFPVMRETYEEPTYTRWYKGWVSANSWTYFLGPRIYPFGLYGGLVRTIRDYTDEGVSYDAGRKFCGWSELFTPTNTRYRDVEVPQPRTTEMLVENNAIHLAEVEWKKTLPKGSYNSIAVRSKTGTLLFTSDLIKPCDIDEHSTLTVTDMSVTISPACP